MTSSISLLVSIAVAALGYVVARRFATSAERRKAIRENPARIGWLALAIGLGGLAVGGLLVVAGISLNRFYRPAPVWISNAATFVNAAASLVVVGSQGASFVLGLLVWQRITGKLAVLLSVLVLGGLVAAAYVD
jgi:hypothetical protein